jgi:hypothetical protein
MLRLSDPVGRREEKMRNPWTTKNPYMSVWLSAANKTMGSARGQATAAVKQQVASMQAESIKQLVDFWSGKPRTPPTKKNPR